MLLTVTILRYIESPGIALDIQQYSDTFRHIEGHSGILKHIKALSRHVEP